MIFFAVLPMEKLIQIFRALFIFTLRNQENFPARLLVSHQPGSGILLEMVGEPRTKAFNFT